MSNNWTREHDRILAEKCEGLTVERWSDVMARGESVAWMSTPEDYCFCDKRYGCSNRVDHYNADIAACFRAAEAWRLKKPGRSYRTASANTYKIGRQVVNHPPSAACLQYELYVHGAGETLHEALYEAVTR